MYTLLEVEEETEEIVVEYICTSCMDIFNADELGHDKDACPNCGERDSLMVRR